MIIVRLISIYLGSVLLFGCVDQSKPDPNQQNETQNNDIQMTKITHTQENAQNTANKIKDMFASDQDITILSVANASKDIIIAFDVAHYKRLGLQTKQETIQGAVEEAFPNYNVTVSTDQKVLIELEKLEQAIENQELSKDDIEKKVADIIFLENDKT